MDIQEILREFDKIFFKQGDNGTGVRTIEYEGKIVTQEEFIVIKLNEE